ncbi:MAG: double-strand break repair protein AddB [Silicimonas sp.]|nr:double-strand break repair protein AddB [Silicimonas sp.]
MFEPSATPRLFGVPPGADFPKVLVDQVLAAHADRPPEALARLRILVNSRRMQRRLQDLFRDGQARLLPRIGLVTDLETMFPGLDLPPPVSRLRRRLELAQLTTRLIDAEPDLAARAAAVDLADSLAALLDEMQGEGMDPDDLAKLDLGEMSEHWDRSLKFLNIARVYLARIEGKGRDAEARRRISVEHLVARWQETPIETPVILAGSTGSRATTRMLMAAVARLPQGALLLPGFDTDLPQSVWQSLGENRDTEDHAQFRFAALLRTLNLGPEAVMPWGAAPDAPRNRLISLSLRPARITDQWRAQAPALADLRAATKDLSLIEAPHPKDEARAIAVAMREAVEAHRKVALITPDRNLSRRVAATLSRWDILPDDSAAVPLSLTPPGRLLRQVARAIGKPVTPETLIALLKHPLTHSGEGRLDHLRLTRRLELYCRARSVFVITDGVLTRFATKLGEDVLPWTAWLAGLLNDLPRPAPVTLAGALDHHIALTERIAGGDAGSGALWEEHSGRACQALIDGFREERDFDGGLEFPDYTRLIELALEGESDRVPSEVRPDVMIWGTLEARVQGADLVILGGLNEGVWPEAGAPDPWLNRAMRRDLGLLLPEGFVGLAAHDYQQAIAAPEVILCRSARSEDGEAVPSRWLNRLMNLLSGLAEQKGGEALGEMKARGDRLLGLAATLDRPATPVEPAPRPAPAPPVITRPKRYSVTEIARLIRDPYAIYGRHVLKLDPVMPLASRPDARLKGIVFHEIVERFHDPASDMEDPGAARIRLREIAADIFAKHVPWPAIRNHWMAHLMQIAEHLIETEMARRMVGQRLAKEVKGELPLGPFSIRGTADRIDRMNSGGLVIYDYKTGTPPSDKQVKSYDRQLLIEALMAEAGVFEKLPAGDVAFVGYLHLGRTPKDRDIALMGDYETVTVSGELLELLSRYDDPETGYISRRAMEKMRYEGDYDHLARFGEWDATARTTPEKLA